MWTWHSPNAKTYNQIDYIMVKKRFRSSIDINRTQSLTGADVGSDHELLMMTFRLRLKKIIKPTNTRMKYDLDKLKDPTVAKAFQAKIGGTFAPLVLPENENNDISTTNLAACVCVSSKFDQFLPARFYFVSKRPANFVRIAKFPYAAFGPLFAFHCPLFVTKNNNLGWNRNASPHTGTCRCNDHGPTVLSARGQ